MKKSDLKKQKLNSKRTPSEDQQNNHEDQDQFKQEEDQVKDEVKLEHEEGPKRWFEDQNLKLDDDEKWEYLEHHGVTFPKIYIPVGYKLKCKDEVIQLTPFEEELAVFWAQSIGSQYETNEIYVKNFAHTFMSRFKKQKPHLKFQDFDFSIIKQDLQKAKQQKKNISENKKAEEKRKNQQEARFYSIAIVDGILEKLSGYQIQPPTLFKGRGAHPKAGVLKPRIMPEEVTINVAQDAPIPICQVAGHSWAQIVCKRDATWLCSYKNDQVSSGNSHKYVFLAPNSKFKGIKDRQKYEKARRLKNSIETIRENYMKMINDKDIRNKQLGTTTYIIDKLALRVGNEKGEDQADTVGCCSLRIQHIKLLPDNQIQFDFLGKDSMRYYNVVPIIPEAWRNIEIFMKNKKPADDLFDKIDAQALNDYLKELMDGLTAKVFRTYNASSTLQKELNKCKLEGLTMDEKFDKYEQANRQVAILCNHQKTVSKKFMEGLSKKQKYIDILRSNLKQLQKHLSHFSAKKDTINRDDLQVDFDGKPIIQKFPPSKEKTATEVKKLQDKILKEQKLLKKKDEGKQIALGTSKTNYNDPRISVAWCKKNEIKIEKVFTKNLLSKFLWAMYTDADWEF